MTWAVSSISRTGVGGTRRWATPLPAQSCGPCAGEVRDGGGRRCPWTCGGVRWGVREAKRGDAGRGERFVERLATRPGGDHAQGLSRALVLLAGAVDAEIAGVAARWYFDASPREVP